MISECIEEKIKKGGSAKSIKEAKGNQASEPHPQELQFEEFSENELMEKLNEAEKDMSLTPENQGVFKTQGELASEHQKSTFVRNLVKKFYRVRQDKQRFFCRKCFNREKENYAKKGITKIEISKKKHSYPSKNYLRHLMKYHLSEFRNHEKEFLKQIDFFKIIKENNYNSIVDQFPFDYKDLTNLANIYFSDKDYNMRKKEEILNQLEKELESLIQDNSLNDYSASDNASENESSVSDNRSIQSEVQTVNKRKILVYKESEEESFEMSEEAQEEEDEEEEEEKTLMLEDFASPKREGSDISNEDTIIKKRKVEKKLYREFFELSCEKSDQEKKYGKEIAKLEEEREGLRKRIAKMKQRLARYEEETD